MSLDLAFSAASPSACVRRLAREGPCKALCATYLSEKIRQYQADGRMMIQVVLYADLQKGV